MSPCSSDFVLDAAFGDALDPASQRALDAHLLECPRCANRRQLYSQQRMQFLGRREFRLRRPMRERSSPLPPTRRFSVRMGALLALGLLWFAIWLSARTG
jgi:hypothetical protein